MNAHVDPSRLAPSADPPFPITGPILRSRGVLTALNDAVKLTMAKVEVRGAHRDFLDRVLISKLSGNAFKVLTAITTRTLPFAKFAEVIPVAEFRSGLKDPEDNSKLKMGNNKLPVFAGLDIQPSTLRKSIEEIEKFGMITKFAIYRKDGLPVHAYAPMSLLNLQCIMWEHAETEHLNKFCDIIDKDVELKCRSLITSPGRTEEQFSSMFYQGYKYVKEAYEDVCDDLSREAAIRTTHRAKNDL